MGVSDYLNGWVFQIIWMNSLFIKWYFFEKHGEISFVLFKKLYTTYFMSNNFTWKQFNFLKNALHYIQNGFLKNYYVIKNRIFNYNLSNRTLIGSLLPEQKSYEQRLTHKMMAAGLRLVAEVQVIQSNTEKVFHMQTWQENRRKANFYFPKYSVSLSQGSVETIGKLKAIGKITLYVISQGWLTRLWKELSC